jgi:hypothetical protein
MKTRLPIILSLIVPLLLLSCASAHTQVSFPSTNTVYTVEDGREFVQLWVDNPVRYPQFEKYDQIHFHSDNSIFINSEKHLRISQRGKLIHSNSFPDNYLLYAYNKDGSLMAYDRYWRNGRENYMYVFGPDGKLNRKFKLDFDPEWYNYNVTIAPKADGSFYMVYRSAYYHYDDDWVIHSLYEYDKNGKYLREMSFYKYFYDRHESAYSIEIGPDGKIFMSGDGIIYHFSPEGKIVSRFKPSNKKNNLASGVFNISKNHLLAVPTTDAKRIQYFSYSGKPVKKVKLEYPQKYNVAMGNFTISKNGNTLMVNDKNGDFIIHSPLGKLLSLISKSHYSQIRVPYPFQNEEVNFGWDIRKDNHNNIYTDYNNEVFSFTQNGEFRYKLSLEADDWEELRYLVFPHGDIVHFILGKMLFYNNQGELKSSRSGGAVKRRHVFSSQGNILELADISVKHLTPDVKPIETLYFGSKIKVAEDFDIDKFDQLHILDKNSKVKVFDLRGNLKYKTQLQGKARSIRLTADGKYIADGKIYNPSGKLLATCFLPFNGSYLVNSANRAFLARYKMLNISINKASFNATQKRCIQGKILCSEYKNLHVFLEGVTPSGESFFSITQPASKKREFSFRDIPQGSRYKIWLKHPFSDFWKFEKAIYTGVVGSDNVRLEIKEQPIPGNSIKIKGFVLNKYLHPVAGVRVSFNKQKAFTNLKGEYVLYVKSRTKGKIAAKKNGYKFSTTEQEISTGSLDMLYINFTEGDDK